MLGKSTERDAIAAACAVLFRLFEALIREV
jgi:hypothetical protein